jgi:non-homologous end joining protein Ku
MSTNFIADAPEPSRSTGKITLSWGLLNIPMSTYTGTEETSHGRKEFIDGQVDHPAGRAIIDKSTGEIVDSARVVRMAQASNGSFVVLDDDEIAACTGVRGVAEVVAFIQNDEILSYVPHKVMQVRPPKTKGVPDPAASKAFSLLVSAMTELHVSALVKVAMRGPSQYAILTGTGDLLFVHSTDGVRKPLNMGLVPVSADEHKSATDLIAAIGVMQAPRIPDFTAQAIGQYVDAKAAGSPTPQVPDRQPVDAVNLMEQLMKSIEEHKSTPKWGAPVGSPVAI